MTPAETILAIPLTDPGRLFPHDVFERKARYHELTKRWHPDVAGGSAAVFAHISVLYKSAEKGLWGGGNILTITDGDGKHYELRYRAHHAFELGHVYVGVNTVGWFIRKEHEALMLQGLRAIGSIRFPDNRMKEQHERFLPVVGRTIETSGGYFVLMSKTEDVVLLSDLIMFLGRLDPKHVAWVMSSLLNILCFYEIVGLTHNGLSAATVFVSPQHHAAFPLGGWWYSVKAKGPLKFLPPAVHAIAPPDAVASKIADPRIDLASVRAIGRAALGDPTGANLSSMADVPKPFANWLRFPPQRCAVDDYRGWEKVLVDSWGARRFIRLDVNPTALYG
jgi:hypothetical protein